MDGGDWKGGLVLAGFVLAGSALAMLSMPAIFARVPTDLERTRFLLRSAKEIEAGAIAAPTTLVLGNSVTMNGVDAALIGGDAYNFSSTGQSAAEGYLYLQLLPSATKRVVLVVVAGNLESDTLPPKDVMNAFYMNGYRAEAGTVASLEASFGSKGLDALTAGDLSQRFASRWVLSQFADTIVRQKLRKDLDTSKSIKSLTYPAPYTKPVSAAAFEKLLPTYLKSRPSPRFSPLPEQISLIRAMAAELKIEGKSLAVVLAPMHPRRLSHAGADFVSSVGEFARSHPFGAEVPILDLTSLLEEGEYIDVVHPTRAGAEKISLLIRDFIAGEMAR